MQKGRPSVTTVSLETSGHDPCTMEDTQGNEDDSSCQKAPSKAHPKTGRLLRPHRIRGGRESSEAGAQALTAGRSEPPGPCRGGPRPALLWELSQLSLARACFAVPSKNLSAFPSQTSDNGLQGCIFRGNLAGYESSSSGRRAGCPPTRARATAPFPRAAPQTQTRHLRGSSAGVGSGLVSEEAQNLAVLDHVVR